jgi:hypothetical protein
VFDPCVADDFSAACRVLTLSSKHKCCLAAERRNVYRQVAKKNILAPEERNVTSETKRFAPNGARIKFFTAVPINISPLMGRRLQPPKFTLILLREL